MTRHCAEAAAATAPSLLRVLLALHCGVLFLQCSAASAMGGDVSALMAFKRAIIEDPHSVLSDWTDADGNACDWRGVICSAPQGSVISLKLSNSSLKGFIAPELGRLSFLQELYLDHNLLFGTIPKLIGSLKNLRVLDLSVNRLTGPIPSELGGLSSVSIVNFHSNGLTGNIPSELGKLQNLVELRLDRNRLKGSIPGSNTASFSPASNIGSTAHNGLCPSSRLYVADFSYNFLVGKIPSCLKYLPRSSFQGNCFQDEYSVQQRPLQICTSVYFLFYHTTITVNYIVIYLAYCRGSTGQQGVIYGSKHPGHKHEKMEQPIWLLALEIATGVLLVVFVITGIVTASRSCKLKPSIRISSWNRSKSWSDEITVLIDSDMLKSLPKLSRQELEVACEDFSNIIGSTPETVVYKGTMKDGPEVSVISLCAFEGHWTSHHELFYQNKVIDLARLNHENIAKFLGYCRESDPFSRMLVFEYAPNGTLFEHLHYGEGGQFSWLRRMKIAIGIAQGLRYLHTELQPPFAISELNSNSVYVTEDFTPKLVDFECWKMMFSRHSISRDEKARGHLNSKSSFPGHGDSAADRQADDIQANTFAFGVILLEIISGRLPYCKDKGYLVDWASKYLQQAEEIGKLVDPELGSVRSEDLAVLCSVVSRCIDPDPSKRPSMQIITGVLENGIDLSAAAILKESSLAWAELALAL
ncbi:putative LRR receptor-like serine/threonine-protein kinase [Zea mays]|uniref:Putative LRR receptor-like serine/threonine-protein kinase n=2 Tax=Zea mays TaxID=4577 RepID=A0A1D6DSR4_MAIZE|nr:putative LRR receptor-like serine/threonine-protein kinase [Zea mays]ONM11950.1 putative LRR receptor-like serine/threonine-protein kinase [Zea mays]